MACLEGMDVTRRDGRTRRTSIAVALFADCHRTDRRRGRGARSFCDEEWPFRA